MARPSVPPSFEKTNSSHKNERINSLSLTHRNFNLTRLPPVPFADKIMAGAIHTPPENSSIICSSPGMFCVIRIHILTSWTSPRRKPFHGASPAYTYPRGGIGIGVDCPLGRKFSIIINCPRVLFPEAEEFAYCEPKPGSLLWRGTRVMRCSIRFSTATTHPISLGEHSPEARYLRRRRFRDIRLLVSLLREDRRLALAVAEVAGVPELIRESDDRSFTHAREFLRWGIFSWTAPKISGHSLARDGLRVCNFLGGVVPVQEGGAEIDPVDPVLNRQQERRRRRRRNVEFFLQGARLFVASPAN